MDLRKLHNNCKKDLINIWVRPGDRVLDCGCGRGGDLWKWQGVRARVDAVDPDKASMDEAILRSKKIKIDIKFLQPGDIRSVPTSHPWDVVCYNFSLHYLFINEQILDESLHAITRCVRPGGILMGITPEKDRINVMCHPDNIFQDSIGNIIKKFSHHVSIKLVDGPFYGGEFRDEPILDGSILILKLKKLKFDLITWEPIMLTPNGMISDMYTKFVFRNNRNDLDRDHIDSHHHVGDNGLELSGAKTSR